MSKEIMVRLELGSASVMFMAEGVAYNPDVADDMVKRAQQSLKYAVDLAVTTGIPEGYLDLEDDDDVCTCDDEDCECEAGECECKNSGDGEPTQMTEREYIEKILRGLDDGN